jgi:Fe-S-cluster containining protein
MSASEIAEAASRLCTACGLCCNGVLFHIVRLQPSDSVKQLESLGMSVNRKKHEPYFRQPCRFLIDCTCTQYAARPERCRLFECQQLRRLAAGEVLETTSQLCIDEAKRRVAEVERMLLEVGNTDVHLPMLERYLQVLEADAPSLQPLIDEMTALNAMLNEHFRLEPQNLTRSVP